MRGGPVTIYDQREGEREAEKLKIPDGIYSEKVGLLSGVGMIHTMG